MEILHLNPTQAFDSDYELLIDSDSELDESEKRPSEASLDFLISWLINSSARNLQFLRGDWKLSHRKYSEVLARLAGNKEGVLINLAFQAWTGALEAIKKEKEFEEAVAKSEKLLKDHAAKQKDQASSVLTRMSNASDTGLKATMFKAWFDALNERKKEEEMEKKLGGKAGNLGSLKSRHIGNARGVQGRVNEQMNMNLLLKCLGAWQIEAKLQHVDRHYSGKIDGKRRQLNSVQTLFKSFARQLEEGLGNLDGDSSGRTRMSRRDMKGGMKESSSLPDIHHRPHVA